MRGLTLQLLVAASAVLIPLSSASAAPVPCEKALPLQVWLDRQGMSPGVIDGKLGANTSRALAAYRDAKGITSTTQANDCDALSELKAPAEFTGTTTYRVTDEDAAGLFTPLPKELAQQAGLASLGYESLNEKLAERFHTTPALIESLNKGTALASGSSIIVPDVEPFDAQTKPARAAAGPISVEVTRQGELRARGADGALLFYAPVSSGSEHDPLPAGQWKVTGVGWLPSFHYNPDLFWDAESTDKKATLAPGPNNPVGVVWIDINVPHYGLHGTPEPSRIGYTQSHGCVRLTNWDAAKLASLVTVGTPMQFK